MGISIKNIVKYPQVFELDFKIRSYEIDFRGLLNPVTLCYMLQEVASSHASSVAADITDLMKDNKTWMLSRLRVIIKKYPKWKDEIRILTWPVGIYRLFAIRDFLLTNFDNDILATATSSWLVIDLNRRKPVKVDRYLKKMYLLPDVRAIDQFLDKPDLKSNNFHSIAKDLVRLSDIDINGHMTSMKYIEKIIDNFDENIQKANILNELLIYFNSEALLNDSLSIDISGSKDNRIYLHRITRKSDDRELCLAKTTWIKID